MARHGVRKLFDAVAQVIFPDVCVACECELSVRELPFCVNCLSNIPFTSHFDIDDNQLLAQKFWGKIDIENCASLTYYTKDSLVQKMIYSFKYLGKSNIGKELGKFTGSKILNSNFRDVDIIIPVPLHYIKEQKGGYNQAKVFALGISQSISKPVFDDVLLKIINNKSQTDKGRENRYQNVLDSFMIKNEKRIRGKHILIVDDVITTGATIEACVNKIMQSVDFDIKISVVSISMALS